jgi:hypothetical protein
MITNCNYFNARWILKTGEIRTLEPLTTAESKVPFQFASSTCVTLTATSTTATSTAGIYNGFTYGEIIISVFVFLIFSIILTDRLFHYLKIIE